MVDGYVYNGCVHTGISGQAVYMMYRYIRYFKR